MINVTYNAVSLQANGIVTTDTNIYSSPKKSIQAEKLAEADGSVIVKETFESKSFNCEGHMTATTISLLDTLIDTFKSTMNQTKENFDIDYGGGIRRYTATPENVIISRERGLNRAGWSVEFFCEEPVGSDTITTTLLTGQVVTSSSAIIPMTIAGSYKAEPVITLTVTSVTGGSPLKTITISNDASLRGISITRDWLAGDVLEIDTLNKTVYVNSVAVESNGLYPSWSVGAAGLSYLDDFTTRSVTIGAVYTKRYL